MNLHVNGQWKQYAITTLLVKKLKHILHPKHLHDSDAPALNKNEDKGNSDGIFHYENLPMQYIEIFFSTNNWKFTWKMLIFLLKT